MEKEYNYNGQRIFVLSSDGDDYDGYARALEVIEKVIRPERIHKTESFFDGAKCSFVKSGLEVEMEYTNWWGVEIKIDERTNEQGVQKVKDWIRIIEKGSV